MGFFQTSVLSRYSVVIAALFLYASCSLPDNHEDKDFQVFVTGMFNNPPHFDYDYVYEYECEFGVHSMLVRRYDGQNKVILDKVYSGIIVDRVMIPISGRQSDNYEWGLYPRGAEVTLLPENTINQGNRRRFKKCWELPRYFYKLAFGKAKVWYDFGGFDLGLLDYSWNREAIHHLKNELNYLSLLRRDGYYYPMDFSHQGIDTLYNYKGDNPGCIKMTVHDKNGRLIYYGRR